MSFDTRVLPAKGRVTESNDTQQDKGNYIATDTARVVCHKTLRSTSQRYLLYALKSHKTSSSLQNGLTTPRDRTIFNATTTNNYHNQGGGVTRRRDSLFRLPREGEGGVLACRS